jgi:hypothetical protein
MKSNARNRWRWWMPSASSWAMESVPPRPVFEQLRARADGLGLIERTQQHVSDAKSFEGVACGARQARLREWREA